MTTHPSKTENKQQSMEQLSFDSLLEEISEPKINTPDKMNAGESNTYQQININSKRFPLNLVIDFDYFINYVGIHPVILTNTQEYISRKHLPAINAQLSMKAGNITDNSRQEYYPYIHFFFHLALRGHLMEKTVISGGKLQLRLTERSKLFHDLSDTEKYFLLLETFWVDLNWTDLQKEHSGSVHYLLPDILTKLIGMKSHSKLYIGKHDLLDRFMFDWHYFLLYFQWFGLWICEKDQKKIEKYGKKNNYFAKTITITSFGRKMFPILMHDRDPQVWNIALRQKQGEVNPIPGSALIGVQEDKQQTSEPFFKAFTDLFHQRDLHNALPRMDRKIIPGVYTLTVAFSRGVWRKVVLSDKHTMEDLHKVIMKAYEFDDDHLYSFFMDGKKWSSNCIVAPSSFSGDPSADDFTIDSVGLRAGKRFTYLYDYGDEWLLTITVDHIDEDAEQPINPYVKAQQGNAPVQYD